MDSFIAYAIFGILTTLVNIVSYQISYSLLSIPNVPSTILAWTLAVIFAFVTNKLWVFDSPSFNRQILIHEVTTFLGARISTGILDVLIMYVAVDIMAWPSLFWKCVSNVIVIVLNYIASKLIIFRKGNTLYIVVEMNNFETPIKIDRDADYVLEVTKQFERYRAFVKKVVEDNKCATDEYPNLCEKHVYENVSRNIEAITNALKEYFSGRHANAYISIRDYIENYKKSPFFVANINENYAFRGVAPEKLRPSIYKHQEVYKKDYEAILAKELVLYKSRISDRPLSRIDMLHIPFDKREITRNYRFSVAGIPCVYLSMTTWGSWLEMGMPDNGKFLVSAFKLPNDLKILNLCVQQGLINGASNYIQSQDEYQQLIDYLEIFPLVLATSFHVDDEKERIFKSEYVISQLIMQACCELDIDGIAYITKREKDFIAYPKAVNLALPVTSKVGAKYWERAGDVELTNPVRFSEFLLLPEGRRTVSHSSIMGETLDREDQFAGSHTQINLADDFLPYTSSVFYQFDSYLSTRKFEKFAY